MNIPTHTTDHDAAILTNAPACPFCGSTQLTVVDWCDETGDYPAIECQLCLGAAPARVWPIRCNRAQVEPR
jgi:hypothetical protein